MGSWSDEKFQEFATALLKRTQAFALEGWVLYQSFTLLRRTETLETSPRLDFIFKEHAQESNVQHRIR